MGIHFYKLHCGGNSFVLVDTTEKSNNNIIQPENFARASIKLCSRKFGIGARGAIFLLKDNLVRIFDGKGNEDFKSWDGWLCTSRYLFDSGKISGKNIIIKTPVYNELIQIISSRAFSFDLGTPFQMESGKVFNENDGQVLTTLNTESGTISAAGIHLGEDAFCSFASNNIGENFEDFRTKVISSFPNRKVNAVILKPITQNTLLLRTSRAGLSAACASASAALITSVLAGSSDKEGLAVINDSGFSNEAWFFSGEKKSTGQEFSVTWKDDNNVIIAGSGEYIFEGIFDLPKFKD